MTQETLSSNSVPSNLMLKFAGDKFIITSKTSAIEIDRSTGDVKGIQESTYPEDTYGEFPIKGLVGSIELLRGSYLIVIKDSEEVGTLQGHTIHKILKVKLIPYRDFVNPTKKQKSDEKTYLSMIKSVFSLPFYFSYTLDITQSFQRIHKMKEDIESKPMWKRADSRFFWNKHMIERFRSVEEASQFLLPIMMGFVSISDIQIKGQTSKFAIVSRRNIGRPGTRYQVRGIDSEGNTANYVETEQILVYGSHLSSFVQVRGSIPTFWTQNVTTQYAPPIVVSRNDNNNLKAFILHFTELNKIYGGEIVSANLADQKGREREIVAKYGELAKASKLSFLKYFPFDFHTECKGMKYENVSNLLNSIEKHIDEMGWFDGDLSQNGVTRINCIDNLDRTNVVQSFFARHVLIKQFQKLGLNYTEDFNSMKSVFNNAWANNADALSCQYASAPAMKTDFTRTGKRTKLGAIMDGVYSVQRYVLNNFSDGVKTDALNLFLGNFKIGPAFSSPYQDLDTYQNSVGMVVLILLVVFVLIGSPLPGSWIIFIAAIGGFGFLFKKNGKKLVNNPRLLSDEQKKKWD